MAVPYLPSNFNPSTPAGANSVTQMVMEQVWPQAFVVDSEFEAETQGFIDSAEVVSLRPMTVSYVIDPKATWSDGYPITAADFEYNWQQRLASGPELAPAGVLAGYRDIESITGSDSGKTVSVVFKTPYSDWEGLFADLVPAHIAERAGWEAAFAGFHPSEVISGGPFKVSTVEPGRRLVLTRNTKYWGPPAHLESIVFLVERSEGHTLAGLRKGTISIAQLPPSVVLDGAVARDDAVEPQLSIVTAPSQTLWQLVFNLNDPLLENPLMREALAELTDRDELVADSIGFDDPGAVDAGSRIFAEGEPGPGTDTGSLGYNPVGATSLLATLGYLPDENGILRDDGVGAPLRLTITGPSDDAAIYALELQLQAEWAASGLTLVIHNVSTTDLLSRALPEGRYQLALAPYVMPAFPTWEALDYTDPVMPSLTPTSLSVHGGSLVTTPAVPATGTALLWYVSTPQGTEPGAVERGRGDPGRDRARRPCRLTRLRRGHDRAKHPDRDRAAHKAGRALDSLSPDTSAFPGAHQPGPAGRHRQCQREPHPGGADVGRRRLGDRAHPVDRLAKLAAPLSPRWAPRCLRYSTGRPRALSEVWKAAMSEWRNRQTR